jgi:uncharacterized repeat protein (TIGR01451 family)
MQSNANIIDVGETSIDDYLLIRYNSDGSVDTSFGNNGVLLTDFGQSETLNELVVQPDDKILVVGTMQEISSSFYGGDIILARYANLGPPDLLITKTVQLGRTPIQPGDPLTYTIVVANRGESDAEQVKITDALPDYVQGADLDQTVTITAGESLTFTLKATLANNAPFGKTITNTAFLSHASGNGQDDADFTIVGRPQLAITKTVQLITSTVRPGDSLTYTIVVKNHGPGNAYRVVVSDTLPAYLHGSNLNQTVDIMAEQSKTFILRATVANNAPFAAVITNTAFVSHISGSGQDSAALSLAR